MFIKALIVQAKWLIWKERNNVKYGNKTIIDSAEMYKQIINQCNKYFKMVMEVHDVKDGLKQLLQALM